MPRNRFFIVLFVVIISSVVWLQFADAAYLTSPLVNTQITSFFDHDNPTFVTNSNFVRYDGSQWVNGSAAINLCTNGLNCYDGHNGTDLVAPMNTSVLASAGGTVSVTSDSCNGTMVRVWHPTAGYSTLYAHLNQALVQNGATVTQLQLIGYSGNSGPNCTTGAHLHFGVRNAQTGGQVMDPYGWSGTGIDPWPYNQGYLWTTNPPSLTPPNSPAPPAPSNVSVTNPTASSLQVNFKDNATNETNILVERKTGASGSWVSLGGFGALSGAGSWYWNNTGLASKITYCYRLKATNAVGSSPYSNESCGTTL